MHSHKRVKVIRHGLPAFLIALWCSICIAADASQDAKPAISIERALDIAKRHVESAKLDVSKHYIASAEWHAGSGLVSFWRIEWRLKQLAKGGQIIVTLDANGKVEHGFGE